MAVVVAADEGGGHERFEGTLDVYAATSFGLSVQVQYGPTLFDTARTGVTLPPAN